MSEQLIGRIQKVKLGKLTAAQALAELTAEASKNGAVGLAVLRGAYAFKWLSRRS